MKLCYALYGIRYIIHPQRKLNVKGALNLGLLTYYSLFFFPFPSVCFIGSCGYNRF